MKIIDKHYTIILKKMSSNLENNINLHNIFSFVVTMTYFMKTRKIFNQHFSSR